MIALGGIALGVLSAIAGNVFDRSGNSVGYTAFGNVYSTDGDYLGHIFAGRVYDLSGKRIGYVGYLKFIHLDPETEESHNPNPAQSNPPAENQTRSIAADYASSRDEIHTPNPIGQPSRGHPVVLWGKAITSGDADYGLVAQRAVQPDGTNSLEFWTLLGKEGRQIRTERFQRKA